jgi:hypothetical protein
MIDIYTREKIAGRRKPKATITFYSVFFLSNGDGVVLKTNE